MINVLTLYADLSGCGDYRVRFPAKAVNARSDELGVRVEVADHLPADAVAEGTRYRIRRVDVPPHVDVVSFQRPTRAVMYGAIMWLRRHRPDVAVVVELDDDLAAIPYGNQAYRAIHPSQNLRENTHWLVRSIYNAHALTVSTPTLAGIYGTGAVPTFVIRNAVPSDMLYQPSRAIDRHERENDHDRVVGWAGSISTHPGDLDVMNGALADVVGVDRTDGRRVTFRNVGPRDGLSDALSLRDDDIEATGWVKPWTYRVGLSELDVGVVPLADNRFNRGKSALKVLEMAAAGVPVVASANPEHKALQRDGMPLWLVKNRRRDWVRAVRSLLDLDCDELRDLALAQRDAVRQKHTIDVRAEDWATAWKTAAKMSSRRTVQS